MFYIFITMLGWSLNLEKENMFYEPYPSYYMIGSILYLIYNEIVLNIEYWIFIYPSWQNTYIPSLFYVCPNSSIWHLSLIVYFLSAQSISHILTTQHSIFPLYTMSITCLHFICFIYSPKYYIPIMYGTTSIFYILLYPMFQL